MTILIEWRNALGCQLQLERARDGIEAVEVLRRMVAWSELSIGDTFHILESEDE